MKGYSKVYYKYANNSQDLSVYFFFKLGHLNKTKMLNIQYRIQSVKQSNQYNPVSRAYIAPNAKRTTTPLFQSKGRKK